MAERLVYIFAWLTVCLIRCLPLSVCFLLGQAIGALMWLILPGYRRLARENLTIAFANEMSEADLRRLTFRHFTTLGANVLCAFKMPSLSQAQIQRVAHFENLDVVKRNIANGRPVIMAINHIGNWELYAQIVFQWPEVRSGTIYQALHNKLVDDLVNRDRRRLGLETFDRKKGFQGAIALLRELGVLGVLVDQHAGKSGVWTPFSSPLLDFSAGRDARASHECGGDSVGDLYRWFCPLEDCHGTGNSVDGGQSRATHSRSQPEPGGADPCLSSGLVLGSQSMEDTALVFTQ